MSFRSASPVIALLLAGACGLLSPAAGSRAAGDGDGDAARRQYTFAWMFADGDRMAPRGGTTRGPEVVMDDRTAPAFTALQAPGLTPMERDRRAILAMVGDYRTSFDFIETVGLTPGYEPKRPYQSWGTERVYLVADEGDFISLQHIIVMHFLQDDGSVSEPMVVKHWRQDWRYEDREVHAFVGRNRFERETLPAEAVSGSWSQTVYQVDDSPRYEAIGRWVHAPGISSWESEDRRRPLPRREFSVRDDYHELYGSHRITITPAGWVMEEDALKLVLDGNNAPVSEQPYLAREAGLSRYERIRDYDFSAGDAYWARTAPFWAQVRAWWASVYAGHETFAFDATTIEDRPMFMAVFALAEASGRDDAGLTGDLEETLRAYLKP